MKTGIPFILALGLVSCGSDHVPQASPKPGEQPGSVSVAERRTALRQQIDGMIADKSCQANAQCRSRPLGYKACGGPDEYVVFSTRQTDESALVSRIDEYDAVDRQYDEQNGGVSDCRRIEPPQLGCQRGQCLPEL